MGINAQLVAVSVLVTACTGTKSVQQIAETTKASVACPSQDFSKFLQTFSDSADVQRQFTSLPLEYVRLEAGYGDLPPKMFATFEEIPGFDRQNGGTILRPKTTRAKEHIFFNDVTGEHPNERKSPNDRVAMLGINNTGYVIYYRFAKSEGCWFLRGIHDVAN
ncbi:MAG TPA: hypothetical protein VH684_20765 [Xanthobacteraceae bacterium]|jgi:hypothetical protein